MTTISPKPFLASGALRPSPKDSLQRLKALEPAMPKDNCPSCSGQVFVGIFFDGTGNNLTADYAERSPKERKHSNIVRLFHTHRIEPQKGYLAYYIPGVGTAFPKIDDDSKYWFVNRGSAFAEKGEHRIIWAFTRLLNAPHEFALKSQLILDDDAKAIVNETASGSFEWAKRRVVLNVLQNRLQSALTKAAAAGSAPKVLRINLSVFGFSRGAAQARTFVNWLFDACEKKDGDWTFAGIPIRLQFLGIFDTVASVGAANLSDSGTLAGHQSWADNTLEIHPAVEKCVHYVAGHEVRACFPLDSVRVKSNYPANAIEVMYPGSHSDVGGGYAPGDLGVSPAPNSIVATIPGAHMYKAAIDSGVPLKPFGILAKQYEADLTPSDTAIEDFNNYLRTAKVSPGPVEDMARKHMSLYFSYRFKHRSSFFQRLPYSTAEPKHQGYLRKTQDCLISRLLSLQSFQPGVPQSVRRAERMAPDFDPVKAAESYEKRCKELRLQLPLPQQRAVEVAKRIDVRAVTPEAERFFDRYVHDSMAGFIDLGMNEYALNGIGLVKFRTVFKGND